MIRPNRKDDLNDIRHNAHLHEAMRRARLDAARRHAAAGLPLVDYVDGRIIHTDPRAELEADHESGSSRQ